MPTDTLGSLFEEARARAKAQADPSPIESLFEEARARNKAAAPIPGLAAPAVEEPQVFPGKDAPVNVLQYPTDFSGALPMGPDIGEPLPPPAPDSGFFSSAVASTAKSALSGLAGAARIAQSGMNAPLDRAYRDALGSTAEFLTDAADRSFSDYGANPESKNLGAQIGRGAGVFTAAAPFMAGGGLGMVAGAGQMASTTFNDVYQHAISEGMSEEQAQAKAYKESAKTVPQLLAFTVGGKIAGAGAAKLLGAIAPTATPMAKAAAGTVAATGSNVAVGSALRWYEGHDAMPTFENLTMDALFGLVHGVGEYSKASAEARQRAAKELKARGIPDDIATPPGEQGEAGKAPSDAPQPDLSKFGNKVDVETGILTTPEGHIYIATGEKLDPVREQSLKSLGKLEETQKQQREWLDQNYPPETLDVDLEPVGRDSFEREFGQPLKDGNIAFRDPTTQQIFEVPVDASPEQVMGEVRRVRSEEQAFKDKAATEEQEQRDLIEKARAENTADAVKRMEEYDKTAPKIEPKKKGGEKPPQDFVTFHPEQTAEIKEWEKKGYNKEVLPSGNVRMYRAQEGATDISVARDAEIRDRKELLQPPAPPTAVKPGSFFWVNPERLKAARAEMIAQDQKAKAGTLTIGGEKVAPNPRLEQSIKEIDAQIKALTEPVEKAPTEGQLFEVEQPKTEPVKAVEEPKVDLKRSITEEANTEATEELNRLVDEGSFRGTKADKNTLITKPQASDPEGTLFRITKLDNEGSPLGHSTISEREYAEFYGAADKTAFKDSPLYDLWRQTKQRVRPDTKTLGLYGSKPLEFTYRLRLREYGPGVAPSEGLVRAEGREVTYDRPLTRAEMNAIEADPVSSQAPKKISPPEPPTNLSPGASNVRELQQKQVVQGADIHKGLRESTGQSPSRQLWEKNFLQANPEHEGNTELLDRVYKASTRADTQQQATPTKPMPEVVKQMDRRAPVDESFARKLEAVSIKNEAVDNDRRERGLPPLMEAGHRTWGMEWEEANRKIADSPQYQDTLINELADNPRPVSAVETAVVMHRYIEKRNEYDRSLRDFVEAKKSGDTELINEHYANQLALHNEVQRLGDITKAFGTENARAQAFRKSFADEDMSLTKMMQQVQADAGPEGKPLSKTEIEQITKLQKELSEKTASLEEREAKIEELRAQLAADKHVGEVVKKVKAKTASTEAAEKKVPKTEAAKKSKGDAITEWMRIKAEESMKALRDIRSRMSSGVDPTELYHATVIGAYKLTQGLNNFSKWSASMITDVGEWVKPHLKTLFDKSKNALKDAPKAMTLEEQKEKISNAVKARVKDGDKIGDLGPYVQRITENVVESGIHNRADVVKAVHGILKDIVPDLTERQTQDAISGYGKVRELSQEPTKVRVRQIKGELQQESKIADMMAKIAPKGSGTKRDVKTDEYRRLERRVNELKKKGGYVVTDPEKQLRTAMDAQERGLSNAIRDVAQEIDLGRPEESRGATPTNERIERLKALLDRLRQTREELFGHRNREVTDEQRINASIKAAERMTAEYERQMQEESFDKKTGKPAPTNPRLEAVKARLEATKAERDELKAIHEEITGKKAADREAQLEKQIEELDKELKGETEPSEKTTREEPSQRAEDLVAERDAMRRELYRMEQEASRKKPSQIEKEKIEKAQKKLDDLEAKIASGDLSVKERPASTDSNDLEAIKSQIDALNRYMTELRREASKKTPTEVEQQKIDKVQKDIDELKAKLAAGDVSTKTRKPSTGSPELEAKRKERAEKQKELDKMRRESKKPKLTPDEENLKKQERALKGFKSRKTRELSELQDAVAKGEIIPKKAKVEYVKDKDAIQLQADVDALQEKYTEIRLKKLLESRTFGQKAADAVKETLAVIRATKTSLDASAVLKQGGISFASHPLMGIKNLGALKQSITKGGFDRLMAEIKRRPNYRDGSYDKAKLFLSDFGKLDLRKMEEVHHSRWAQKIPGIAMSERLYVGFLNKMRADVFDHLKQTIGSDNPSVAELRDIGNWVNITTGRGDLGKHAASAGTLSTALFAPRFLVSRIQFLTGQPLRKATTPAGRRIVAKEYIRTVAALGAAYTAYALAGAQIETDPRSSDALKAKFGKIRQDPTFGLSSLITLGARLWTGESKYGDKIIPNRGEDVPFGKQNGKQLVMNFLANKAAPIPGAFLNAFAGKDPGGNDTNFLRELALLPFPMSVRDTIQIMKEGDMNRPETMVGTAILALLSLGGTSTNVYEDKTSSKPSKPKGGYGTYKGYKGY